MPSPLKFLSAGLYIGRWFQFEWFKLRTFTTCKSEPGRVLYTNEAFEREGEFGKLRDAEQMDDSTADESSHLLGGEPRDAAADYATGPAQPSRDTEGRRSP